MPALFIARLARVSRLVLVMALVIGSLVYMASPLSGTPREGLEELSPMPAMQPTGGVPAIEGWVTEQATGKPIAGATVRIAGASKLSGEDGYFAFSATELALSPGKSPNRFELVRAEAETAGFAIWSLDGARYYPGDTLRLYPRLTGLQQGSTQNIRPTFSYARGQTGTAPLGADDETNGRLALVYNAATAAPPPTIRVYRTATGVVEVVPFREYVKHVLPNEWVPSWAPEALKAGAMAVKSYGWYWISRGGKQVALGADVKDNVDDQVYDPNVSYASTDAAVDATFNYAITRNGELFQAQYCAGNYRADPAGDCPWPTQYMTQWGSSFHADQGRTWGWILGYYYSGAEITPRPPGGVYTGPPPTPSPIREIVPAPPAPPVPPTSGFAIGQGSTRSDLFEAAFNRNGGASVLGHPTGPVRWWLQYVTEHNVVAQPFSGADGQGNTWLVFDVLKANDETGYRAYLLNGDIAAAYADHTPPGPEWIGAPTSDPYLSEPNNPKARAQSFARGTLVETSDGVQLVTTTEAVRVSPQPDPPTSKSGTSAVRVRVQWLGRAAAPSDSWVQPLALHLSRPGDPTVVATYHGTTDRQGVALFDGLPRGVYNVHVKGAHSLQTARGGITLNDGATVDLDMKAQIEGDTDGDNCVTVADFSVVQSMLGTHKGTPGFNPAADLNGDGSVTMSDVSLLRSGFDMCGDISADNDFQPLSLAAPNVSQHLSPWLNPSSLQKGLSMTLVASNSQPRSGDSVEIRVQAISGSQPVDGASFLLRYDPTQLAPIDSFGNPALGVEPDLALPSVMGNWIDPKGGLIGFAASMVQGTPPIGEFSLATIRFRVIGDGPSTSVSFDTTPVGAVQLTNGGTNLLGQASGLTLTRQP